MPLFLRRARTEVPELLAAEGYFEPEVSVDGDAQRVLIAVVPGPRVTVSQVELTFSGPLGSADFEASREAIRKGWLLPEGSFFRAADWDKAKQELLESARNDGFLRARLVESEARVTLETTAAQLRVELESGERVQFGDLVVNGLQRYPQSIVEGLRGFSPGEPYSAAQIVRMQMRLSGSGYFNTVNVRPDVRALENDPSLQQVPIRVDVSEANSKRLSLGGGYNTDGGISALIGWSDKNVLGQGLQFGSGLELDQQQQIVYATLDTPYDLSGGRWQLGAKAWHKDVFNDITNSTSLFVSRGRRIGDYDHAVSLQYQYEIQNVVFSDTLQTNDTSQAVVLGYSATLRRLDSLVNPTRGYIVTGQVSGASQSLGSDRSFGRAYGFGWLLVPMPQVGEGAGTLVLRGEAGIVFASSSSGIPSQNLFRTGGMRSVRGYASQSLGVPVGEAILSGRYLLVGSVEYQHPIDRELSWAVFYDRGNATDSLSNFSTVAGYGAGIRYRTPVGPLSLDLAWGEEVRKLRVHFAIGLVF
jgi:translocation and assembly module TamA